MSDSAPSAAAREERILVITKPYIGDTVLALPFLRNLRRAYPAARIDVCAEGRGGDLLAACPHVDELVPWTRRQSAGRPERGVRGALAAIESTARLLRSRGYTRAYVLKQSLSAVLLAKWAGIPYRVGFDRDLGRLLLTRAVPLTRGRHQVELYLDLLRADGLEVDDARNDTWQDPTAAVRVDSLLAAVPASRPRVFLAVQATKYRRNWLASLRVRPSVDPRQWTPAKWAALIEWLVAERGCEVVLCGGPADAAIHALLRDSVSPATARHLHDLSERLSLRELGSLLARMQLCIGVDTGPVHVAASVGTPIVKLVGGTDQTRWGPWGATSAIVQAGVARDIPVAAVSEKATLFLAPPRPLRSIDLRQGSFRYEVVETPTAAAAAAEPATKPLAQAH
jgi:heptosyltransferase-2